MYRPSCRVCSLSISSHQPPYSSPLLVGSFQSVSQFIGGLSDLLRRFDLCMSMEIRALVLVAMAAAVLVLEAAAATTYTVGAPDGLWDMQTNYAEWVAKKTFHPGDKITFTYSPELHDVVEVSKAGYDACSSANNISAFRTGNDVVALTAPGTRYFLCGLTGHCDSGMKIRIDVVADGSSPMSPAAAPTSAAASAAPGMMITAVGLAVVLLTALHHHAIVVAPL